jgi:hypothetical protein
MAFELSFAAEKSFQLLINALPGEVKFPVTKLPVTQLIGS